MAARYKSREHSRPRAKTPALQWQVNGLQTNDRPPASAPRLAEVRRHRLILGAEFHQQLLEVGGIESKRLDLGRIGRICIAHQDRFPGGVDVLVRGIDHATERETVRRAVMVPDGELDLLRQFPELDGLGGEFRRGQNPASTARTP